MPIPGFGQNDEHGPEVLARKPTPSIKYHRKSKNSYFLRYGERWVDKLRSSSYMLKFYCITDVIRVMVKKGYKLMKGSVHEDYFVIIHDALVLMT